MLNAIHCFIQKCSSKNVSRVSPIHSQVAVLFHMFTRPNGIVLKKTRQTEFHLPQTKSSCNAIKRTETERHQRDRMSRGGMTFKNKRIWIFWTIKVGIAMHSENIRLIDTPLVDLMTTENSRTIAFSRHWWRCNGNHSRYFFQEFSLNFRFCSQDVRRIDKSSRFCFIICNHEQE